MDTRHGCNDWPRNPCLECQGKMKKKKELASYLFTEASKLYHWLFRMKEMTTGNSGLIRRSQRGYHCWIKNSNTNVYGWYMALSVKRLVD